MTTISAGTVVANKNGSLGTAAGGTTIASGAVLQLSGPITLADAMTVNGTGISNSGSLRSDVGAITESDVLLATTSEAIIIGFNVRPERAALATAERESVDIRLHTIIYELTDEIKKAMAGLLEPVIKEVFRGRAQVREVFKITKVGMVAGCMVTEGTLTRDSQVRLLA